MRVKLRRAGTHGKGRRKNIDWQISFHRAVQIDTPLDLHKSNGSFLFFFFVVKVLRWPRRVTHVNQKFYMQTKKITCKLNIVHVNQKLFCKLKILWYMRIKNLLQLKRFF